ncbi:MAG: hypothetical protein ACXWK7_03590, partial [Caulobacteraceae bacterium]
MRRAALALVLVLAGADSALAQAPYLLEPTPQEKAIGAVDVCVRWGADPAHLAEVIMTNSSGDKDLDAKIPDMIRSIPYPKPTDDAGEWFAARRGAGHADRRERAPDGRSPRPRPRRPGALAALGGADDLP